MYGDGLFETILAVDGRPEYLDDHLQRLQRSCKQFRIGFEVDARWTEIVHTVLEANQFLDQPAVVKIIVTRGAVNAGLGLVNASCPTVIVMARPHSWPPKSRWLAGVRLALFPSQHTSPIAHHKSLNYLYYLLARQYATDHQADEAILLDPHENVLECATANIFYRCATTIIKPPAEGPYLKGIIEQKALPIFRQAGFNICERYFGVQELLSAAEVFITNSVIRVMPVAQIAGKPCSRDHNAADLLRRKLNGRPFKEE